MQPYFADGEADLTRTPFVFLNEEPELAREFIQVYSDLRALRPGFADHGYVLCRAYRKIPPTTPRVMC